MKKRMTIKPEVKIVKGYTEGTNGYTEVVYAGINELMIKGKTSKHLYRFEPGAMRVIDTNDAVAFLERDDFGEVELNADIEGDISEY